MALIHSISAFDRHGLQGIQALQRDWSPYIVHFTAHAAMDPLRNWRYTDRKPATIAAKLRDADADSFNVVQQIAATRMLRAHSPSEKDGIANCVCFSECNLPGLVGHSERFGRFGFVFEKGQVFGEGARPCYYMASDEYAVAARVGRGRSASTPEGRLFSLANVYRPPGAGGPVQDFSHEREWRLFSDLNLEATPPSFIVAPNKYLARVQKLFPNFVLVPLDTLFVWGA